MDMTAKFKLFLIAIIGSAIWYINRVADDHANNELVREARMELEKERERLPILVNSARHTATHIIEVIRQYDDVRTSAIQRTNQEGPIEGSFQVPCVMFNKLSGSANMAVCVDFPADVGLQKEDYAKIDRIVGERVGNGSYFLSQAVPFDRCAIHDVNRCVVLKSFMRNLTMGTKIDIPQREDLKSVIVFESFKNDVGTYATADGRTTGPAVEYGIKAWVFSFPELHVLSVFTALGSPPKQIEVGVDERKMPRGGANGESAVKIAMNVLLSKHCTNKKFDDDLHWLLWPN